MGVSRCRHQEGNALGQHRRISIGKTNSRFQRNPTRSASSRTPQVEGPGAESSLGGDQGGEVQRPRLPSTHVLQAGHLDW